MGELGVQTICSDCQAPIIWLLTVKDNRMPIDAEPNTDIGNVLRQGDRAGVLAKTQAAAARKSGAKLHTHHRLTCPHAHRWARPAGRRR